jgi:hypothetical protein
MRKINLLWALLGAAILTHAQAQTAPQAAPTPPPLGPGPLLNRAPAFSQWLFSVKAGAADPRGALDPAQKYDQRTLVTVTNGVRREISAYADGHKTENWYASGVQATFTAGQTDPTITVAGANARAGGGIYNDYSKSDFPGFEWISRHNYTGVALMMGIPCIVFHDGPLDPTPAGATPPLIPQTGSTAFIAADSRLPILLQTDIEFTVYQWEQPPSTALTLPVSMQSFINTMQTRYQQAVAPPAIP